jgi:YegS/Rv2252/BmrU family lipid kinase
MTTPTLVIINPNAGGNRGFMVWKQIERELRAVLGEDVHPVITREPDEVPNCIKQATEEGVRRVVSIGGDGTNNVVINAVLAHNDAHPEAQVSFGCIPAGTGRDWARGAGTPLNPKSAVAWIAQTQLRPIDVGVVRYGDTVQHFLNISSAGISNHVVQRVENAPNRGKITYLSAILSSLMQYRPKPIQVEVDGKPFYEGGVMVVAVANGRYFAQGLFVAPSAQVDDGMFDVVLAEEMPLHRVLYVLALVYRGKHVHHPKVRMARGQSVRIATLDGTPFGMDIDGEGRMVTDVQYEVRHHALNAHI